VDEERERPPGSTAAGGPEAWAAPAGRPVLARSPGRVNLIGDHTDYNDGLALPMAIDLGTSVTFVPDGGDRVVVHSQGRAGPAEVDLEVGLDPHRLRTLEPAWARYVAAVVATVRPDHGGRGWVRSTLPAGAGLSSSAALEVALALALGLRGEPLSVARTCQRAEHAATGVPTGLMDQLTVTASRPGHALLVDFARLTTADVALPEHAEVVVVHSGEARTLEASAYAARRAECEAAARGLGPLGAVDATTAGAVTDPVLRRRARHVASECERVRAVAAAFGAGDLAAAGACMTESHRSLAEDFEVSTPTLDALVGWLVRRPGVLGARLTGAGFGGCVVALTEPGALDPAALPTPAWRVRAAGGARVAAVG